MGDRNRLKRKLCVNCNICVNNMRRYPALTLDPRVSGLLCTWVYPLIITEGDYICEECRDLAMSAVDQCLESDVSGSDSQHAGLSLKGHSHVCLLCGCSLLRRKRDKILRDTRTDFQRSIVAVIENKLAPRQITESDYVCHACWLRTQREVRRMGTVAAARLNNMHQTPETLMDEVRQMPLTGAERQKRYRERLKIENPTKYEEKRKIHLEHVKKRQNKIKNLSETEINIQRKKWREANKEDKKDQLPLSGAERQKRYRERLKIENPTKYEELRKIHLEHVKKRRKRIINLSETEKNIQRKKWREAKKKCREANKKDKKDEMPLTGAERQKRYRERLKIENPTKYEEKRKIHLEHVKKRRKQIKNLSETEKNIQRKKWREARKKCREANKKDKKDEMPLTGAERQKRYRERLKIENPTKYEEKRKIHLEHVKKRQNKIKNLSQTEINIHRKKWRDSRKKCREANNKKKDKKYQRNKRKTRERNREYQRAWRQRQR